MKKFGVLLIALGIFSAFLAFNVDVIVSIGLLNNRQNIVYLSGILFLAGIILFGFGVVTQEDSKTLKAFTLWTFLTPIILLATIKVFTGIQQYREEQAIVTYEAYGLMWQKCSIGKTWTGDTCSGEATEMTWNDAMNLSVSFAGHNDWRLPTTEELMTLFFCSDGIYGKNGSCTNKQTITQPTINSTFPNTKNDWYWCSPDIDYGNAEFVNFSYGDFSYGSKGHGGYVRLVRSN